MASTRRRTATLLAVPATLLGALCLAPTAQALVYCVDVTGGDCNVIAPDPQVADPQAALDAASGNPGPDFVRLGPQSYTAPSADGFEYDNATDPVGVIGSGTAQTTLTTTATGVPKTIVSVTGASGTSYSDLRILLPNPMGGMEQYRGVNTHPPVSFTDVLVEAPQPFNGFGMLLEGGGSLTDSTISQPNSGVSPSNTALQAYNSLLVEDVSISGDQGISYSGAGTLTLRRSMVNAFGQGLTLEQGSADLASSWIRTQGVGVSVGNPNGAAAAETIGATLDGVTIVGYGGGPTTGVRVFANGLADPAMALADNNSVTIANSILDQGLDVAIEREADDGGRANATTAFSNFDPASNAETNNSDGDLVDTGLGSIASQGGDVDVPSGFVDQVVGNLHLTASSPLIDIGDPVAPPGGVLDLDGDARALDGSFNCTFVQRRDIGADEYAGATQGSTGCPSQTPASAPAENPECETLRQKIKRLTRKIRQAADPARKATLKRKRRNARNRLAALGCSP